jgi:hypothetical protein
MPTTAVVYRRAGAGRRARAMEPGLRMSFPKVRRRRQSEQPVEFDSAPEVGDEVGVGLEADLHVMDFLLRCRSLRGGRLETRGDALPVCEFAAGAREPLLDGTDLQRHDDGLLVTCAISPRRHLDVAPSLLFVVLLRRLEHRFDDFPLRERALYVRQSRE